MILLAAVDQRGCPPPHSMSFSHSKISVWGGGTGTMEQTVAAYLKNVGWEPSNTPGPHFFQ